VLPFGITETPARPVPSAESVIFPDICLCWAATEKPVSKIISRMGILASNRVFILVLVFKTPAN
jgi:hypothetical protein